MKCSALEIGGLVGMFNDPCGTTRLSTIEPTSRHPDPKTHVVATDVFTGSEHEQLFNPDEKMYVSHVVLRD